MGAAGTIREEVRMRREINEGGEGGSGGGGVMKRKKRETNGDGQKAVEENK